MTEEGINIEPPRVYTPKNVCYWEPESKQLVQYKKDGSKEAATLLKKAEIILENDCVEPRGTAFAIKPIKGYNKTTYLIEENECNCQGFQTKLKNGEKPNCSHLIALKQWRFIHDRLQAIRRN